jgi:preprotein translocase subunit YajC
MRVKFVMLSALGLALAVPSVPAIAQASAPISVGMQVTDATGGAVGTVTAINGDNLIVKTDKHEVALPKTSFTPNEGKLLFGMTQAQLNAEVEKSLAAADAAVVAGATVKGLQGTAIGTIDKVEADGVTIKLASGQLVRIARAGVRGNADGSVTVGLTAEQLEAEVAKASSAGNGK